jgi:flavin reductase (DIM6/NTAB) family NADH-FMN oxidoreductase RutF
MSSDPMPEPERPVTSEEFRRACGRFATGVSIAAVVDEDGRPHGLTVNSFTSVSLCPPLILICLAHTIRMIEPFRRCKYFGITVLSEDQRFLSDRFARPSEDRFEGLDWRPGQTGAPVFGGALAIIECALRDRLTAGDHDIFVGEVVSAHWHHGEPLIYFGSQYRSLAPDGPSAPASSLSSPEKTTE